MTTNVGTVDRIIRIALGVALIAIALGYVPGYQTIWGWIGVVPLATGLFGTCPIYSIVGISSCKAS